MSATATGRSFASTHDDAATGRGGSRARWRYRFSVLLVAATLFLIYVGGLVTSHGAGLSVPDWPLSYGMLMPPMVGNVFYEHGHRMVATGVGFLTLVLAVWTARSEPRPGVRLLAWAALGTVVAQGVLGGLTVIYLLPTPVSVAHACLAQTFLCVVIALAYVHSREWHAGPGSEVDAGGLRAVSGVAAGVVFLQLVLGAVMRHTGAGLAIRDFPLAFGAVIPPLDSGPVAIHFAHRVGAVAVTVAALMVWLRAAPTALNRHALALLGLVALQIALGGATVLTAKAPVPTSLHVVTGAATLGAAWLLFLRARRAFAAQAVPASVATPPLPATGA